MWEIRKLDIFEAWGGFKLPLLAGARGKHEEATCAVSRNRDKFTADSGQGNGNLSPTTTEMILDNNLDESGEVINS